MQKVTAVTLSLGAFALLASGSCFAQGGPPPLPAAPSAPPPMPAAPSAQYYYNDGGKQAGPFSAADIQQKLASGLLTPDTLIWKSGTPSWVAVKTLPEFAAAGGSAPGGMVADAGCAGTPVLSDDFDSTNPDETLIPEGGKLKFKALAGKYDFFTYKKVLTGDADVCVTAQIPHKFNNPSEVFAGILFAGDEGGNTFNVFLISPTGNGSMLRLADKGVDLPVSWHRANGLNPAPGAKNRIRVSIRGNTATFYVNNQQFASFNGPLPNGAGKLGVLVKSEPGKRDSWKFANFRATTP